MKRPEFLSLVSGAIVAALCGCGTSYRSGQDSAAMSSASPALQEGADKSIAGRCHCGDVTYEAEGPAVKCEYCDCRGCQRATGTFKVPFVSVRREGFKVTAGKPGEFRAKSGVKCDAAGVWHFCPRCGTQVFWKAHRGDEIDIFAGTLDDPSVFQPKKQ